MLLSEEVRLLADSTQPQSEPRLLGLELYAWADRIAELEKRPTIACHNALQEEKDGCFAAVKKLESQLEEAENKNNKYIQSLHNTTMKIINERDELREQLNKSEGIICSLKGQLEK